MAMALGSAASLSVNQSVTDRLSVSQSVSQSVNLSVSQSVHPLQMHQSCERSTCPDNHVCFSNGQLVECVPFQQCWSSKSEPCFKF